MMWFCFAYQNSKMKLAVRSCSFILFLLVSYLLHAQPAETIRLNQVGYFIYGPKLAVITVKEPSSFSIVSVSSGRTVYQGRLGEPKQSAYSSTITRLADFSTVHKPGTYKMVVPGLGASYPFTISDKVYDKVGRAVIKGF
jgi:endoglucanase